tara:strand:+ start:973 stop:1197 length:225 start_codon:yes stop_codon:yes gene_type:complete
MKWNKFDNIMEKAKPLATSAIEKSKPYASQAWSYAKENPGDVLLGLLTFSAMDIADSLDDIEEMDGFLLIDKES